MRINSLDEQAKKQLHLPNLHLSKEKKKVFLCTGMILL
jgi:hypothetical protein